MLNYPNIDPVALSLGPVKVHWYGVMYMIAFLAGWWLAKYRASKPGSRWTTEEIGDLVFYVALGVVLGGRLGYVLFYGLGDAFANPLSVLKIWQGGMSFHGGVIGVCIAMALYARKTNRKFLQVTDFIGPLIPVGLFTGRIGNFINAELWGKPTDVPWSMVFPTADMQARHPSMLYEALLEGFVLFIVLWWFSNRPRAVGAVTGLGLMLYGVFRIFVEFFRVPDLHMGDQGYLAMHWLTMGQVLSLPMIIAGVALLCIARGNNAAVMATSADKT